jgi:hypothetical protein
MAWASAASAESRSSRQNRHVMWRDHMIGADLMSLQISPHPTALNWRSFRRVKTDPTGRGLSAQTGWNLRAMNIAMIKTPEGELRIKSLVVSVGLDHMRCWVVKGDESNALLEHERQHYIFAALVGSELYPTLLALRASTQLDLQQDIRRTSENAFARVDDISARYDRDTDHSRIAGEQTRWENQVRSWQTNKQLVWP